MDKRTNTILLAALLCITWLTPLSTLKAEAQVTVQTEVQTKVQTEARTELNNTYLVGVETQDYAPFSWLEKGRYRGLMRELLDAFAAKHGYLFRYEPYPIPRLYRAFRSGKVDLKFPDHPNWGSEQKQGLKVHYSELGIPAVNALLTLAGDEQTPLNRLRRVGTVLGFTVPELRSHADRGTYELYEVNNLGNLLKMLQKRHVRGIYFDANVARYYLKRMDSKDLVVNEHFPLTRFKYRLSSIHHPHIVREFDAFLRENVQWVEALFKRYDVH